MSQSTGSDSREVKMLSPQPLALSPQKRKLIWKNLIPGFCGASLTLAVGLTWSIAQFGSVGHAWLYANGVRVLIDNPMINLPEGKLGDHRNAEFLVYNLSTSPIQILGVNTSCGCLSSTDELPTTVPPRGIKALRLTLHLEPTPSGKVEQSVIYHTDEPTAPDLAVKVSSRVIVP